jgi:hypothetical protein
VVLLDPNDTHAVVGLNPLSLHGRSSELVADQLLAVFHGLYAANWGPRTQDILHAGLLTLTAVPGLSLIALPLLLEDAAFRRRIVGALPTNAAVRTFWQSFEHWSDAERTTAIAPVLNKTRPFLLRSSLRRVIGQVEPRFDINDVFNRRKVLLVNLAKGELGPEAAALLGSLVVAAIWNAAQGRAKIATNRRWPVHVYVDEFQDYLHLPTDLADVLAQARGLVVGLTLAHQHLAQLAPAMRSAVMANARSRICFQLSADDARIIAGTNGTIDAADLQELPVFEAYAQLVAGGAVQHWCSLRTVAPMPPTGKPEGVATRSRLQWAVAYETIDAGINELLAGTRNVAGETSEVGARRRQNKRQALGDGQ